MIDNKMMLWAQGARVGENANISPFARFYGAKNIIIGNHVRIDDFAVITAVDGLVEIGDYTHIAAGAHLFGSYSKIIIGKYCGVSSHCSLWAGSDDYTKPLMTNPTIPEPFRKTEYRQVTMADHSVLGSNSVMLPGCELDKGCRVGANSLCTGKYYMPYSIYSGSPAKLRKRYDAQELIRVQDAFESTLHGLHGLQATNVWIDEAASFKLNPPK